MVNSLSILNPLGNTKAKQPGILSRQPETCTKLGKNEKALATYGMKIVGCFRTKCRG
jgi:hypothetical protein